MAEQKRRILSSVPRAEVGKSADRPRGGASVSAPNVRGRAVGAMPTATGKSAVPPRAPASSKYGQSRIESVPDRRTMLPRERGAAPPRQMPPMRGVPEQAKWRHIAEPSTDGGYRSPRFRGGTREYVPEQDTHRKGSDPSPVKRDGMGELKKQTPVQRRAQSKQNRRQKLEKLQRRNFRKQFRVVDRKKQPRGFYLVVIVLTLGMYLAMMGGLAMLVAGNLFRGGLQNGGSISYTLGTEEYDGYLKTEIRYGTLFRDGVMMLNMNHIAGLCELTTTGDLTQMHFYSRGELGHEVVFHVGTRSAVVNGVPITLAARSVLEGDTLYVSADFFERFAGGLDIVWDEKKESLTITRRVLFTSVLRGDEYAELTFGVEMESYADSIDRSTLDLELQMRIEADYLYGVSSPPVESVPQVTQDQPPRNESQEP